MKAFFQGAGLYKFIIFYVCLFSINSLSTIMVAEFTNIEWGNLTPTAKFVCLCVIAQNWTGTLIAFFNQSISRIQQGKSIISTSAITGENTQVWKKEDVSLISPQQPTEKQNETKTDPTGS